MYFDLFENPVINQRGNPLFFLTESSATDLDGLSRCASAFLDAFFDGPETPDTNDLKGRSIPYAPMEERYGNGYIWENIRKRWIFVFFDEVWIDANSSFFSYCSSVSISGISPPWTHTILTLLLSHSRPASQGRQKRHAEAHRERSSKSVPDDSAKENKGLSLWFLTGFSKRSKYNFLTLFLIPFLLKFCQDFGKKITRYPSWKNQDFRTDFDTKKSKFLSSFFSWGLAHVFFQNLDKILKTRESRIFQYNIKKKRAKKKCQTNCQTQGLPLWVSRSKDIFLTFFQLVQPCPIFPTFPISPTWPTSPREKVNFRQVTKNGYYGPEMMQFFGAVIFREFNTQYHSVRLTTPFRLTESGDPGKKWVIWNVNLDVAVGRDSNVLEICKNHIGLLICRPIKLKLRWADDICKIWGSPDSVMPQKPHPRVSQWRWRSYPLSRADPGGGGLARLLILLIVQPAYNNNKKRLIIAYAKKKNNLIYHYPSENRN